ncbi:hypothetical protein HLH34_19050 [Gluconacetobacter azotocaptans]|uniref:Uncharacterized protein n=1 Tax=Gluconacetobacter azotocaptans TaxID=142834 RepID=A0A7W4JW77_9PROT|nr:hypothetical protein [Gluconacetobacter azotocaptans]MBB2192025.1 hypothetical protein [Gluconacetobacter azotocaptans]GBQ31310.1 hypothetical protein AA13594_2031 [Gluconacetobacter azotocaptans DSM 13594]
MTDASKIASARENDTASDRLTLTLRTRDPRLVALVRLLARQAADDYVNATRNRRKTGPTK